MIRLALVVVFSAALTAAVLPVDQSQIQNGKVETRQATSIAAEVAALGGASEPVWIGWKVPMIDGDRDACSSYYYGDGTPVIRGALIDTSLTGTTGRPQIQPPTGPIPLEGGTQLALLIRVVDRRIERLRSFRDDCPLDAGGRTIYWLASVTPAESLKFLDALTRQDGSLPVVTQRTLAQGALSAIALHRDTAANPILDRIATTDSDPELRRLATQRLGSDRGTHGFETIRRLIAAERLTEPRFQLVRALGLTRQPQTAEALLALARTDPEPKVRAEAAYYYPQRAGMAGVDATLAIIANDAEDSVKIRAVSGLARLPTDQIVPRLIELARTSKNLPVRRQSVSALAETKDPRAFAYLAEIVGR